MPEESFTRVTSQSWFGRIGDSVKGVLLGVILFVAAFPLLLWNEGRAVTTAKSLAEGAAAVVSISPDKIQQATEGKLVHMTGEAKTKETLTDPVFEVAANAIKLERLVETYQWKETAHIQTRNKLGGGTETITTYTYSKDWANEPIDSSKFAKPEGHKNPSEKKFPDWRATAETVTLGAFGLSKGLINLYSDFEPLAVGEAEAARLPAKLQDEIKLHHGEFFAGKDPDHPEVGDTRIGFVVAKPGKVSVIARQSGVTFARFATQAGRPLEMLQAGDVPADVMFREAMVANNTLAWVLRGVGFFVMFLGLTMLFRPLVAIAAVVPFFADLLGLGVGIFAFFAAAALSLGTIAVGWFAYRPVLAIGLFISALGAVWLLKRFGGKRRARRAASVQ